MKERFREIVRSYFISVTLINAAMFILGSLFMPEQRFGYEAYLYPLIYGAIASLPALITGERKELPVRQTVIREIIHLALIIVLILAFMFGGRPIDDSIMAMGAGVAASAAVIFVMVKLISWLLDLKTARSLNEDLVRFQNSSERTADDSDHDLPVL